MQAEELEEKKRESGDLKQVRVYCIVIFYREIQSFLQWSCPAFEDHIEFLRLFFPQGTKCIQQTYIYFYYYFFLKCTGISHAFVDLHKWITAFCFMQFLGIKDFKAECLWTGILKTVMHYLTGDSVSMETYKLFLGNALHLYCISHLRFFKCLTDVW